MRNKSWKDTKDLVNATVYVDGQEVIYNELELVQTYGQHDYFTLSLDYDVFGHAFMDNPLHEIKLLGKRVTIEFSHGNLEDNRYVFVGLVMDMSIRAEEGQHARIILKGGSNSVLLDRGKRYQAFGDTSLSHVFNQITEGLSLNKFRRFNNPKYDDPIDFLMQYNETDWEFLQRLAYLFGENMYYDGSQLVFGNYPDKPAVSITYDEEIQGMEFTARLLHNEFTYYQYLDNYDRTIEAQSTNRPRRATNFIAEARDQADIHLHTRELRIPSEAVVADGFEIQEMAHRRNERTAAQTMVITGKAKTYIPFVGRIIEVNLPDSVDALPIVGTYRVMKAIHRIDHKNKYSNTFEGASARMATAPIAQPNLPLAVSMPAIVVKNDDPNKGGKVKVNFPYGGPQESYWMRVMSVDAGVSDKVATNRGMVFIPEIGDQVMIGFELGDPNRPYVMGSLFNEKTGKGGGASNTVKSIITRSGHTLKFTEDESIELYDSSGNHITLDTKGKNITLKAPETISLIARNIQLQASEHIISTAGQNIAMTAERNITENAGENHEMSANNSHVQVVNNTTVQTKKYFVTCESGRIEATIDNLQLASSKEVEAQSTKRVKLF